MAAKAKHGQLVSIKIRVIYQQVADSQAKDIHSGHQSPGNLTIISNKGRRSNRKTGQYFFTITETMWTQLGQQKGFRGEDKLHYKRSTFRSSTSD